MIAAADAAAQHPQFTKDVPGIAEGPAEIRGRIVHPSRASAASGLPVVLYALPADGPPGLRNTESGEDGSFAFHGVSNDPATVYLVGARAGAIAFARRVTFAEGEQIKEISAFGKFYDQFLCNSLNACSNICIILIFF